MAERKVIVLDEDDEDVHNDADLEGGRMPFLAHLFELRARLRNAAIAFVLAFVVCWYYAQPILDWLRGPLFDMWRSHPEWGPPQQIYTGLMQPFWVNMSLGLWAGVFVSSPVMFYQLWKFVAPGLYKRERKVAVTFAAFSGLLFVSGALFCFEECLPRLYAFFLSYNTATLHAEPNLTDYFDLTRSLMLAFGAVFELPVFICFLAMVGVVTHRGLWKFGRWFIVLAFIGAALLAPGPCVTQIMIAVPMIGLYYISIIVAWRMTKRRERKQELELAREAIDGAARRGVDVVDDQDA